MKLFLHMVFLLGGFELMADHNVVVILKAKEGKEQELQEELLRVRELSQKEKACLEYKVQQDINDSTRFVLNERWSSQQEHAKQFEKEYIVQLVKKLEELLHEPFVHVMTKNLN